MAVNPSPQRQRVVTFPTPNVHDYLFYETVDAQRIGDDSTDIPEYGTKHPDTSKWPNHRLVHVKSADDQNRYYRYYYASDQIDQDDDNWSSAQADIGGTKFDAISRDYVTRRSEFNFTTPAQGASMVNTPTDKFSGTYVLAERKQRPINDEVLDGLYIIETRTYVEKTTIKGIKVDEFSNESHAVQVDLYYRGEVVTGSTTVEDLFDEPTNAYWDAYKATAGGTTTYYRREGRQLTTNWFSIETVPIISGADNGDDSLTVQDYDTSMSYSWPAVLSQVNLITWNKRAGGSWIVGAPIYSRYRYSGPCRARVVVKWRPTKFTDINPDEPPLPTPIYFATPYFRISVPACLHVALDYSWTNGTTDPTFEFTESTLEQAATNQTDWASFILSDTQKPAKGGFLRETITIYPPNE